ncbi:MAG: autotransporter-associated beta strand repeat-containing protein [Verrucomicrobiota bacterium]
MKPTHSLHFLAGFIIALLVPHYVQADSGTWINDGSSSWSTSGNWSGGTVADGADFIANFNTMDLTADRTVSIDSARSIGSLVFGDTNTTSAAGWILDNNGNAANVLTLSGVAPTISVNALATDKKTTISARLAGTAGMMMNGGGTLELGGANTLSGTISVGSGSAGNALLLVNGGTMATNSTRSLSIGNSTFGGNRVTISTPGTKASPSLWIWGNNCQFNMGVSSSNNCLTVSNGAYLYQSSTNGINTCTIGTNAGANSNSITVTGTGSTIDRSGALGSTINVGAAGDGNGVTISAGGLVKPRRWVVGANGGDNNFVLVTGSGASSTINDTTNSLFEIGSVSGSDGNYFSVEAGGLFSFSGTGNSRNFSIGRDGSNNYLKVSGTDSTMTVGWAVGANNSLPVGVGGFVTGVGTITDGGSGNYLEVSNGGAVTLTTSLYVLGVNSVVYLGNGSATGTLTVGAATGGSSAYSAGIYLKNASGRLNFNGGRLIAATNGELVSGAGQIQLDGPACFSTGQADSTVATSITGSGTLTKEDGGTLTLSGSNSYTGDTVIQGGVLRVGTAGALPANSKVILAGGTLDLNGQSATVKSLMVSGTNTVIDFGTAAGSNTLRLTDGAVTGWTGNLRVLNFDMANDRLFFGASASAINGNQSRVVFVNPVGLPPGDYALGLTAFGEASYARAFGDSSPFPVSSLPGKTYAYDSMSRLTRVTYPDGRYTTYQYDAASNLSSVLSVFAGPDINGNGVPDSWEIRYFGTTAATGSGPDSNHNGTPDLMEFALAADPTRSRAENLPVTNIRSVAGHNYLHITFHRNKQAPSLTYTPQVSSDLKSWQSGPDHFEQVGNPVDNYDGSDTVVFRCKTDLATAASLFVRITVNSN